MFYSICMDVCHFVFECNKFGSITENMFYCVQNNNIFRELDIVLWELRYPVILSNVMKVQLCMHLRLLLISNSSISLHDPLINDVLRAMCIDLKEVCVLNVSQINNLILPIGFSCHCWWIGITALRDFHGALLCTSSLSMLKCDARAKRNLWYQIGSIMRFLHKSNL